MSNDASLRQTKNCQKFLKNLSKIILFRHFSPLFRDWPNANALFMGYYSDHPWLQLPKITLFKHFLQIFHTWPNVSALFLSILAPDRIYQKIVEHIFRLFLQLFHTLLFILAPFEKKMKNSQKLPFTDTFYSYFIADQMWVPSLWVLTHPCVWQKKSTLFSMRY